ncbi:hypothetical protein BGX23_009555 [Mortierella sp. AD031]|nr:hypothetical protein BGX23_009555 [Mortierella sp. AD031]KAG0205639.1 hypothetical protein BGX33_007837 [Mortierella sp. NVP41]
MSGTVIPTYTNPCLAPSKDASTVYLAGVSDSSDGRLEIYTVNLKNVSSPTITLSSTHLSPLYWKNSAPKYCSNYPADESSPNPIHVQQFGPFRSYDSNAYSNGIVENPSNFVGVAFTSPKNFAIVGHAGSIGFVAALTNTTGIQTGSIWSGTRLNATNGLQGTNNAYMQNYPTSAPLISVGTFTPSATIPARGYLTVFDNVGAGKTYSTTGYDKSNPASNNLLILGASQNVDMNSIKLTSDAIPVNMGGVGYILDKANDGNTVIYTINPSKSNKLEVVQNKGNLFPFTANIAATSLNTQIITYRVNATSASFNSFDTITGTWAGVGLLPAPKGGSGGPSGGGDDEGGKAPLGAIIGGVVGGLVAIALIAFLVIRSRRQKKAASPAVPMVPTYLASDANQPAPAAAAAVQTPVSPIYPVQQQQSYDPAAQYQQPQVQYQQPQQQQQQYQIPQPGYDPRLSYNPYGTAAPAQPAIFQPQQLQQQQQVPSPYTFQATPQSQQQQPYIFAPSPNQSVGTPYSQPSPGMHFQAQTPATPTPEIGSPSQQPVIYQPPVAGYPQ